MRETLPVVYVNSPVAKRLPVASALVTGRKYGNTLTAEDRQAVSRLTFRTVKTGAALPGKAGNPHLAQVDGVKAIGRRNHSARAYARYLERLDRGLPMA